MRARIVATRLAKNSACRLFSIDPNTRNVIETRQLFPFNQHAQINYHRMHIRGNSSSADHTAHILNPQYHSLLKEDSKGIKDGSSRIQLPQRYPAKQPELWAKALDCLLPPQFCTTESQRTNLYSMYDAEAYRVELTRVIFVARKDANIDILSYLAIEQGRWEAYLWICSFLISSFKREKHVSISKDAFTDIDWPRDTPLSALTGEPFVLPRKQGGTFPPSLSLDSIATSNTLYPLSHISPSDHAILGEIWRSLGHILLESSRKEEDELRTMVSKCLLVIAHLHHAGFIPERAHQHIPNRDSSALVQPPLLHHFSESIIASLLDVMTAYQQLEGSENFNVNNPVVELTMPYNATLLSPEIWLEFVLWCCVHGEWQMDGTAVVQTMSKIQVPWQWSVKPDRKLIPTASESSYFIPERTLSSEVVVALTYGLLNTVAQSKGKTGAQKPVEVIQQLLGLKEAFKGEGMNLGLFTWTSVVARLCDIPEVKVSTGPKLMFTYVLPLGKLSKAEKNSINQATVPDHSRHQFSYIFQDSSAMAGIYHQTIREYIKGKDLRSALRELGQLQAFTDTNKLDSLKRFLDELTSTPLDYGKHGSHGLAQTNRQTSRQYKLRGSRPHLPGHLSNISIPQLADLLDLVATDGDIEVGYWMINSKDADGPLVPRRLFGNQHMAPSLIRFAVRTRDWELLSEIRKAKTGDVFGSTLAALSCSRVALGDLTGAAEVIGMLYTLNARNWNIEAFTGIIKSLVVHADGSVLANEETRESIRLFIEQLTNKGFGEVWGMSRRKLHSLVALVASCEVPIQDFFIELLVDGQDYVLDLSLENFATIMTGAMELRGSIIGKTLWEKWCSNKKLGLVRAGRKLPRASESISKLELFSRDPNSKPPPPPGYAIFTGRIPPTLPTLRLIIRQALNEHCPSASITTRENTHQTERDVHVQRANELPKIRNVKLADLTTAALSTSTTHEVLEWAAQVLHSEPFTMSYAEIIEELHGYIPLSISAEESNYEQVWRTWDSSSTVNETSSDKSPME